MLAWQGTFAFAAPPVEAVASLTTVQPEMAPSTPKHGSAIG